MSELLATILRKHNIDQATGDAIVNEFLAALTESKQTKDDTFISGQNENNDAVISSDEDEMSSSEDCRNYLDYQDSSFANFFSNIGQDAVNYLKKSTPNDSPAAFYMQPYKTPAKAAASLGIPSDHLWRIDISGTKKVSNYYTNKGIPHDNCWYYSLPTLYTVAIGIAIIVEIST